MSDKKSNPEEIRDEALDQASGGFSFGVEREIVKKPGQKQLFGDDLGILRGAAAPAGKDGSKSGNVETTWKIEEGET
ncbi:MAG: hypothetical protein AAGA26_11630 [Pseudomonadota bacterium]